MSHALYKFYIHYVFSTKKRLPLIKSDFEKRLWSYMAGIGKKYDVQVIQAGGTADHIHLLVSMPPDISVSKAIQLIKGNSSKWINDTYYPVDRQFKWQSGYAAFSVGQSNLKMVKHYILNQKKHHQKMTYKEEYAKLINAHKIPQKT
mgnify:CR=1 FL=1